MKKRMLAALLALVMLVGALSATAAAKGAAVYADVSADDWFYGAVGFVTENGLMTGTHTGFEPQRTTSRAMLWTILSRLDGQSAKRNDADWYAAAQLWAVQNDISDGTTPDAPITREQLASMLYRYAQRRGLVRAASSADLGVFADAAAVSAYAEEAMQWAVEAGLLNGMGGKLCPQGAATRAQVAEILRRMCEKWSLLTQDNAAVAASAWLYDDPEHTHSWTYTANKDGTHTAACTCGETKTEYCTLVTKDRKSWKCSTCGFVVEGEANAGVSTWRELETAVENGKSPIYLAADIAIEEVIQIKQDTIFYGCGHTLTLAENYNGPARKVFNTTSGTLILDALTLDGENKASETPDEPGAVIRNSKGCSLIIRNCMIENFVTHQIICSAWSDITIEVSISNTTIQNNTLTSKKQYNDGWDREITATLLWLSGSTEYKLTDVTITGNKVTRSNAGVGDGYLILMKDGAHLNAENLLVEDNEAGTLLGTYNTNKADTEKGHQQLKSGRIENNVGHFDVYCDLTIGEGMTIDLGTYVLYFTNSSGVRTLTNNGKIIARVEQHPWGDGKDAIYTGTGELDGELIGFEIQ